METTEDPWYIVTLLQPKDRTTKRTTEFRHNCYDLLLHTITFAGN